MSFCFRTDILPFWCEKGTFWNNHSLPTHFIWFRDDKGWVAPHLFSFLQAQVGWVPTRNSHFLRYIETMPETNSEEKPWTSMFGRWFISFWGNFGVFHVSFRECVYLSLDTFEHDFASAKQCWFFSVVQTHVLDLPPPPSIPVAKWRFTWIC